MDFSALEGHQDQDMLSPGNAEVAQLRADAIPLLRQIDEREGLRTQKVVPLPAGMWNALYRLEPAGVVVKLSFGDNSFEVNFLRRATALGIPAPQVSASGVLEHPTLTNATYFLMSYIPNALNAWHLYHSEKGIKTDALRQLGHDLGQALAKLHHVHLGYITRLGTKVGRWKDTLTDGFSPDWDNPAPNALFDKTLLPIFKHILHETNYFSFQDGRLIHCDLNLSNVLVDTETHALRAIIDPAGYAGMPMFDLAYTAMPWDYGIDFYNSILSSYQGATDRFDPMLFYTSILVVAYRHDRFHTAAVREAIYRDILPNLNSG
jgi:aminoglycoside phosphotransferase (APT) family kinase protein